MLNAIIVMGRLVKDIELRHTATGTPVCQFTLACERDFKGQDGNKETDFIDCVAWRNTAEFVSRYFSKGRMMIASGNLQFRSWQDKDGKNHRVAEVVVSNAYFGDSKEKSGDKMETLASRLEEISDDGDLPF